MIGVESFAYFMQIMFCLLFLIWFFSKLWVSLWVDVTRQSCFEIRDNLFMLAVDGYLQFDDPMYRRTRNWLNACVRHAHELNIWVVIGAGWSQAVKAGTHRSLIDDVRSLEDGYLKSQLIDIHIQAARALVMLPLMRSPLILFLIIPIVWIWLVAGQFMNYFERGMSAVRDLSYSFEESDRITYNLQTK